MDFNILESKLTKYYEKFSNPTYVIGDWAIVDDVTYKKLNNKLNIVSLISYNQYNSENIIIAETKKEYYAIKYSGRFVCVRKSETEYGLLCDTYDLLAINKPAVGKDDIEIIPFKDLCDLLGWKLGKKAKEYLDYFE
jgi:hypothetical protein